MDLIKFKESKYKKYTEPTDAREKKSPFRKCTNKKCLIENEEKKSFMNKQNYKNNIIQFKFKPYNKPETFDSPINKPILYSPSMRSFSPGRATIQTYLPQSSRPITPIRTVSPKKTKSQKDNIRKNIEYKIKNSVETGNAISFNRDEADLIRDEKLNILEITNKYLRLKELKKISSFSPKKNIQSNILTNEAYPYNLPSMDNIDTSLLKLPSVDQYSLMDATPPLTEYFEYNEDPLFDVPIVDPTGLRSIFDNTFENEGQGSFDTYRTIYSDDDDDENL